MITYKIISNSQDNNYIEMIGMPAAGKTTLSNNLEKQNLNIININKLLSSYKISRQLSKVMFLILFLLKNPKKFFRDTLIIRSSQQSSTGDLIIVLLNWYLIMYLNMKYKHEKEVRYLFDQGVFQALWSIYYKSNKSFDAMKLIDNTSLPKKVYFLDESDKTLRERSSKRKKKVRLNYNNDEDVKKARNALKSTLNILTNLQYEIEK